MTHATQAGPAEDRARRFIEDSYIKIEHAFGADLAARCREELWMATGLSPDEPEDWTRPVVRVGFMSSPPFVEAANTADWAPSRSASPPRSHRETTAGMST